jgi:hypothetical protein
MQWSQFLGNSGTKQLIAIWPSLVSETQFCVGADADELQPLCVGLPVDGGRV